MAPISPENSSSPLASLVLPEDIGSSITDISKHPFSQAGGFADVYAGTHITAGKVALKRLRLDQDINEINDFLREAETWRSLRHPRLLEFIGIGRKEDSVYLVSPFISKGTLRAYIKDHPNADRPRLLRETCDAVVFLHNSGVLHGDLKANNILISDEIHVLLCDFGLARACHDTTATVARGRGSLRWMSPEVLGGDPKTTRSDTYSFGMTVIEVLTGNVPFTECGTDIAVMHAIVVQCKRISRPSFDPAVFVAFSYMWDIADMCTLAEPEKRPEMAVVHALFDQLNSAGDGSPEPKLLPAPGLRDLLERANIAASAPSNTTKQSKTLTFFQRIMNRGKRAPNHAHLLVPLQELAPSVMALEAISVCISKSLYGRNEYNGLAQLAVTLLRDIGSRVSKEKHVISQADVRKVNRTLTELQKDISDWSGYSWIICWLHRRDFYDMIREHENSLKACRITILVDAERVLGAAEATTSVPQHPAGSLPAPGGPSSRLISGVVSANESLTPSTKQTRASPNPVFTPTSPLSPYKPQDFHIVASPSSNGATTTLGQPPVAPPLPRGSHDAPAHNLPPSADSLAAIDLTDKVQKLYAQPTKKGGFADIYEGIIIVTGQKIAIKSLRRAFMDEMDSELGEDQERLHKRLKREIRVWQPLRSPRIVPCIGYAYLDGAPCLISPWYANGNAKDYITANPCCDRRSLVMQIAEGLAYLHNRTPAIVHYELKSNNVLIDDDGCAKLTDFGIAKIMEEGPTGLSTTNDQLHAVRCSSPEALSGGERTVQSDVYSFACFALETMTGKAPFYRIKFTVAVIGRKCGGAMPDRDDYPELDAADPLWPLLEACWNMDPEQRPTMTVVMTDLRQIGFTA